MTAEDPLVLVRLPELCFLSKDSFPALGLIHLESSLLAAGIPSRILDLDAAFHRHPAWRHEVERHFERSLLYPAFYESLAGLSPSCDAAIEHSLGTFIRQRLSSLAQGRIRVGFSSISPQAAAFGEKLMVELRGHGGIVHGGAAFPDATTARARSSRLGIRGAICCGPGERHLRDLAARPSQEWPASSKPLVGKLADVRLARTDLYDWDDYQGMRFRALTVVASRGCPHAACTFCTDVTRAGVVPIDQGQVARFVERGRKATGATEVDFVDQSFPFHSHAGLLGQLIEGSPELRVTVVGMPRELRLSRFQDADWTRVSFFLGIESFDASDLRRLNKPSDVVDNIRALKVVATLGSGVEYYLMHGIPGQGLRTMARLRSTAHLLAHLPPPARCTKLSVFEGSTLHRHGTRVPGRLHPGGSLLGAWSRRVVDRWRARGRRTLRLGQDSTVTDDRRGVLRRHRLRRAEYELLTALDMGGRVHADQWSMARSLSRRGLLWISGDRAIALPLVGTTGGSA